MLQEFFPVSVKREPIFSSNDFQIVDMAFTTSNNVESDSAGRARILYQRSQKKFLVKVIGCYYSRTNK